MLRGQTVFEDVVKTICTTNTAWSGTRKMTHALVDNLGLEAPGGGRTFPTPQAMAGVDVEFYREVVRAGYRGPYLKQLATEVAEGTLDLEELHDPDLPDDEVAARLLALPGVGPYGRGARDAHVARPLLAARARLVDAPDVLQARRRPQHVERRDNRAAVQALRRVGRSGLLALPDAGLGRGRVAHLEAWCGIRPSSEGAPDQAGQCGRSRCVAALRAAGERADPAPCLERHPARRNFTSGLQLMSAVEWLGPVPQLVFKTSTAS
jgi:hypothetical protein